MTEFNKEEIERKSRYLKEVAAILKTEFFGLDDTIDRIINSVTTWYTFPELLTRPVIVNVWGLTGVGKTHLIRRLSELLGFKDKFMEVQMDGIATSSSYFSKTLASLLGESTIAQGEPGIVLLDEFQRYRTIDSQGLEVKLERFQDVWMLLSDGKFAADISMFRELEMILASALFSEEEDAVKGKNKKVTKVTIGDDGKVVDNDDDDEPVEKSKFKIYPYEAKRIKDKLKLTEPISEIMLWDSQKLYRVVAEAMKSSVGSQLDYTKCLIFISGNLDEAYTSAQLVDDCDTDADVFFQQTKRVNVMDIKASLKKRFKPEQISRFGNTHIIYPSINRRAYEQIIRRACNEYVTGMNRLTGIEFKLDSNAEAVIYNNSVYPTQGTRPVLSSVQSIFGDSLAQIAAWAIKTELTSISLDIDSERSVMIGDAGDHKLEIPVNLDVDFEKKATSKEFTLAVAVHEAAHSIVYAVLFNRSPLEVKINTASYKGGYMVPELEDEGETKVSLLNTITVLLAGRAAEELVFGEDKTSTGAVEDLFKATQVASNYNRLYGFGGKLARELKPSPGYTPTSVEPTLRTDAAIEGLLQKSYEEATRLLIAFKPQLIRVVEKLLEKNTLSGEEFRELLPEFEFEEVKDTFTKWDEFRNSTTITLVTSTPSLTIS